jgi:hypothetical protein
MISAVDAQPAGVNRPELGEPWGLRLWLTLGAVVLIAGCLQAYGINKWPMADDEVPTLVELGLLNVDGQAFSVPASQIEKLPKVIPVWYVVQRQALAWVPHNEFGFRIPSLIWGILTSVVAFLLAARWRGLWFGVALSLVQSGSLPFIYLAQIDRFYSMTLLLVTLSLAAMCVPRGGSWMVLLTAVLAVLSVFTHNITVGVFVLAFMAACPAYVLGRIPRHLLVRAGAAALVSVLLYLLYLRPLVQGWHGTGNPTPVLISFAAHVGVPALALALFGCWLSLGRSDGHDSMIWWALLFAGSLCFFQVFAIVFASVSFSPHYFLFFLPPFWILAAHATEAVARRVSPRVAIGWYCCVAIMLAPALLSHYQDGSRHDYRQAAALLRDSAREGQPILSDDAETISYYLPEDMRRHLFVRTKVTQAPQSEFFLVYRMNAWAPLPQMTGRQMDLIGQIYRRRFDQFSHILRVYRVAAAETTPTKSRIE